jgi:nitroreductase
MNVSKALLGRKSVRAFTNELVEEGLIKSLLAKASRSPSGGNLQPWKILTLNNDEIKDFLHFQKNYTKEHTSDYSIYPENLKEPYNSSRKLVGEQMYSLIGISRDDKEARINQVMKNFYFFGAPAALFCLIDRQMGPPQWSDLGMFLQSFMLLAYEEGLGTCAQEAWSLRSGMVKDYFKIDDNYLLFCGVAIGYEDLTHPINQLKTMRQPLSEWVNFQRSNRTKNNK